MEKPIKTVDRFQIVGFVVSTAISIGLILLQQDTIISVTLGLVLATLTQLFDIQLRNAESEERILKANILNQKLYRDEWLLNHIRQIVDDYYSVKGSWFNLFRFRAETAVTDCYDTLHSLAEGYMTFGARSPFAFGDEGITDAENSLKAVTTNPHYWRSLPAKTYLQKHSIAIKRGVKITRIFIVQLENLSEIQDVIEEQENIGVDVYLADVKDLPREMQEIYIIMDDKLVTQAEFTPDGTIKSWRMFLGPREVEAVVRKFEVIMRRSRKLEYFLKLTNTP
jgi:hypothetical protein